MIDVFNKKMKENQIQCPIAGRLIDDRECFDVHMVIEEGAPLWSAPQDIVGKPDFRRQCLSCAYYHAYFGGDSDG